MLFLSLLWDWFQSHIETVPLILGVNSNPTIIPTQNVLQEEMLLWITRYLEHNWVQVQEVRNNFLGLNVVAKNPSKTRSKETLKICCQGNWQE